MDDGSASKKTAQKWTTDSATHEPGIVDQHIDGADLVLDASRRRIDERVVGDVHAVTVRRTAARANVAHWAGGRENQPETDMVADKWV